MSLFCLYCRYNLTGLSENRCPECGREFDPNLLLDRIPRELVKKQALLIVFQLIGFTASVAIIYLSCIVLEPPKNSEGLLGYVILTICVVVTVFNSWIIAKRFDAMRSGRPYGKGEKTNFVFLVVSTIGLIIMHVILTVVGVYIVAIPILLLQHK